MCVLGNRCYHGQCVGGPPLLGCIGGGPQGCSTCAVGVMSGGSMEQIDGVWVRPEGSLYGVLISGAGWKLKDVGRTGLPIDTLVLSISEDGGPEYPANEKWFESHWLDISSAKPVKSYSLTVLRPDCDFTETLIITRA